MALINTKNPETIENTEFTSATPIEAVYPSSEIDAVESDRFAKLVNSEEDGDTLASVSENPDETLTLEELQQQFMDTTFKAGFNRTIEKAKEIIKEMKE